MHHCLSIRSRYLRASSLGSTRPNRPKVIATFIARDLLRLSPLHKSQSLLAIWARKGRMISLLFGTAANSPRNQQALLLTNCNYWFSWMLSMAISIRDGSCKRKKSFRWCFWMSPNRPNTHCFTCWSLMARSSISIYANSLAMFYVPLRTSWDLYPKALNKTETRSIAL